MDVKRVRDWLQSPAATRTAALWGFTEGTLFFFIPDIIFTATALFSIRAASRQIAAVLAGALVAGMLMFSIATFEPTATRDVVSGVPFVRDRMFANVDREYRELGPWALVQGPMRGTPYKVYAVEGPQHTNLLTFLLISLPARLLRFIVTAVIFASIGALLRRWPPRALAFHLAAWAGVYVYYWTAILRGDR
jgi:membrane protein YqaA with SNARE-associated domain